MTAPKPHAHDYVPKKLNACKVVQNAVECIAMHPESMLNAAVFSNIFWIAKLLVTATFFLDFKASVDGNNFVRLKLESV